MTRIMIGSLLLLMIARAGYCDAPTTAPAKLAVIAAKDAVERETVAAKTRFEASAEGRRIIADRDAKAAALDRARSDGTPTDRIQASSAYNKARLAVEKARQLAVENDPGLAAAVKAWRSAEEDEKRAIAELAAKPLPKPDGLSEHEWELARLLADGGAAGDLYVDQLAVGRAGKLKFPAALAAGDAYRIDATVIQVISKSEIIAGILNGPGGVAWVQGLDASSLISGQKALLPRGEYCVPRTKTYASADGGTTTVFVLEPIDSQKLQPAVDYLKHANPELRARAETERLANEAFTRNLHIVKKGMTLADVQKLIGIDGEMLDARNYVFTSLHADGIQITLASGRVESITWLSADGVRPAEDPVEKLKRIKIGMTLAQAEKVAGMKGRSVGGIGSYGEYWFEAGIQICVVKLSNGRVSGTAWRQARLAN